MLNDIKNTIQLLQYPKVKDFLTITTEQLLQFIKNNELFQSKYQSNLDYYIGKNTYITKKSQVDKDNPDSRVSVSYARTQTTIVKGYMYKPGLITYQTEDEAYQEILEQIWQDNNEPLINSELGEAQSKFGIGIELIFVDDKANVKFINVNPIDVILIWSMDIIPRLVGAIRYYLVEKTDDGDIWQAEVYFVNRVEAYQIKESIDKNKTVTLLSNTPHFFGEVPFIIYINNQEYHADYEPIKPLIDAYDVLMSDSINEMNRFASAYLILKNFILNNPNDGNEKEKELQMIKSRRVIELMNDGEVTFLTKDIPSEFFDNLKATLREDIEFHSHIPDFRSKNFEAKSGVSQQWSLFDFENLCADKEALFKKGLYRRLELINKILVIQQKIQEMSIYDVDIKFTRNTPLDLTQAVDNFVKLAQTSKLADEDLLALLPKEILPSLEDAIKRAEKQKAENMALMDFETQPSEDSEESDKETA